MTNETTSASGSDRPRLLVVASGMQTYREYLLQALSADYRLHLFHTVEPSWERPYLHGWTVLESTIDGPAMVAAARDLAAGEPFGGVLCWDEGRILAASEISEALKLPGGDPAGIWRIRDKAQTRAALTAAGIAQPRSIPVATLPQALQAAALIGYPVVLKPRGLGASLGVVKVAGPGALEAAFGFTAGTPAPDPVRYRSSHPVLVEECVGGAEISVDSVVQKGRLTPMFVARKVVGYPPYAEEVGHFVDAADPLLDDQDFLDLLQDVHTAVGYEDGVTHTEFMLTAEGPRLIEINGRLGGDLIPYLGMLATGISPGPVAAAVACGQPPPMFPQRKQVAAIRFFYVADDDTTLGGIGFDEAALPEGIDRAVAVARPGAVLSPPPKGTVWGRIAYATVTGDSIATCRDRLEVAEAALHYEPA
jgi:hypothetical protein